MPATPLIVTVKDPDAGSSYYRVMHGRRLAARLERHENGWEIGAVGCAFRPQVFACRYDAVQALGWTVAGFTSQYDAPDARVSSTVLAVLAAIQPATATAIVEQTGSPSVVVETLSDLVTVGYVAENVDRDVTRYTLTDKGWRELYRRTNAAAHFDPATPGQVAPGEPDNPDTDVTHPLLTVAGVGVFVYVTADGEARVSIDFDEPPAWLMNPDGTVKINVRMNGEEIPIPEYVGGDATPDRRVELHAVDAETNDGIPQVVVYALPVGAYRPDMDEDELRARALGMPMVIDAAPGGDDDRF